LKVINFVPKLAKVDWICNPAHRIIMPELYQGLQQWELIKGMLFRQQEQIKAAWSLLSTLHCLLLPDKVKELGKGPTSLPQFWF
jgi:hypothetical protein